MFLQMNKRGIKQVSSHYSFFKKSRKGISPVIGYVLLISFVVILGVIVYQWLSTYVPKNTLECPDDVSFLIENYTCQPIAAGISNLNLTIKNNGLFGIAGYFIHSSEDVDKLATIDLSSNFSQIVVYNAVMFAGGNDNFLNPPDQIVHEFNVTQSTKAIELIPVRWQKEKNKLQFASCGEAKIRQEVDCA